MAGYRFNSRTEKTHILLVTNSDALVTRSFLLLLVTSSDALVTCPTSCAKPLQKLVTREHLRVRRLPPPVCCFFCAIASLN